MTSADRLADIEAAIRARMEQGTQPCNHPRELAIALGAVTSTSWERSMAMVDMLIMMHNPPVANPPAEEQGPPCNHQNALGVALKLAGRSWEDLIEEARRLRSITAPAPATGGGNGDSTSVSDKFKMEIPEFSSTGKFEEYRPAVRNFMFSVDLKPAQCKSALFAIKGKWKGERLSRFSDEIDPNELLRPSPAAPDWSATREFFLEWLDGRFQDPNHFINSEKEWLTAPEHMRKRDYGTANDFYLAFESILYAYNASCSRANRPRPAEAEITKIFLLCLPETITRQAETLRDDFEVAPYRTHRNLLAKIWASNQALKHTNVPANARSAVKRERDDDSEDEEEAAARAAPRRKPYIREGHLDFQRAPTSNKGPAGYFEGMTREEQSSAKARRDRLRRGDVCRICRWPKSAHKDYNAFEPFTSWDGPERTAVRWAPATEEENTQGTDCPDVKEENT